jgi:hypothetical protein
MEASSSESHLKVGSSFHAVILRDCTTRVLLVMIASYLVRKCNQLLEAMNTIRKQCLTKCSMAHPCGKLT